MSKGYQYSQAHLELEMPYLGGANGAGNYFLKIVDFWELPVI